MKRMLFLLLSGWFVVLSLTSVVCGQSEAFKDNIYDPGILKPTDSQLKVRVGDRAPDFTLPSVSGEPVTLSSFRDKKKRGAVICPSRLDAGLLGPVAGVQYCPRTLCAK